MKKVAGVLMVAVIFMGIHVPVASAEGSALAPAFKSLLIPGWGQYQNGEFETEAGKVKVGVMAALEVAAIITTAVVGGVVGAPQVWAGIGLFIANHAWSALDAFVNAKESPSVKLGTQPASDKVSIPR